MSSEISIPLVEPDLRGNEARYLADCVNTGWISSAGKYVGEMERRLAEVCGTRHAVATSSGTTAIQLALMAANLGDKARVIVPDWTFAASINAVVHAGAIPVLVDVDRISWALDPALVEEELAAAKHKGVPIAAVVAVDPLGATADFATLAGICRKYGALLVEDAAGAIGSSQAGKPAGGLGDAGILSFNGNKLATGGGGAILTDREEWAVRARHLSGQARKGHRYEHDAVGFNYRTTNLNAAVVVAQLERLNEMVEARRHIAAVYDKVVAGRNDLTPLPVLANVRWNGWMYAVRTASAAQAGALTAHMRSHGIEARPFWLRLSAQAPYAKFAGRITGVSESLSGSVVSLPCNSTMTDAQIATVADALRAWRGDAVAA